MYQLNESRFSTHPAIARPGLEPFAYGNVFFYRAKALLGSMLAVPSRETVFAFLLLANVAFANGAARDYIEKLTRRFRVRDLDDDRSGCPNESRPGPTLGMFRPIVRLISRIRIHRQISQKKNVA